MPLVSRIVAVGGGRYLDGAMADSIPLRFFESLGYERNLVILTQPAGYLKKPSPAMPLLRFIYRKYPLLVRAMEERHVKYNETVRYVEEQAAAGRVLLMRPESPLPIKRITRDPDLLQKTYDLGRHQAERRLKELKEFFA